MKLAEALLERKDLKTKVDNLRARAVQSALVQEGDVPAEVPTELLREMNEAIEQLGVLIRRINATNNVTQLADGTTISDATVQRDMLELRRLALDVVLNKAAVRQERFARNEIKFVPTIAVAAMRRESDAVAQARRELDTQIQAVHWSADLVE
jgi:2-iminoacetate synthase ThiH